MVAGHHPQSMTVDIVEEDQDDIETETPVQRQEMTEMSDLMLGVEVSTDLN